MLRSRGPSDFGPTPASRRPEVSELAPVTPGLAPKQYAAINTSRAVHRSPSNSSGRAWATDAAATSDAEAGRSSESPKKADIPAHRRGKPLLVMAIVLAVTLLMGAALIFEYNSGKGTEQALERLSLATEYAMQGEGNTLVQFTAPGLKVPIRDALDLDFPVHPDEQLLHESPIAFAPQEGSKADTFFQRLWSHEIDPTARVDPSLPLHRGRTLHRAITKLGTSTASTDSSTSTNSHTTLHDALPTPGASEEDWPPPGDIKLLVGVTSACCSQVSLQRRAAVRRTWAALTKERYPRGVQIMFFLAQPKDKSTLLEWLPALEAEVREYNDTVVVRGHDTYLNLPNKTFRLFRYALAHPEGFTHVLKADDDTWVRMHRLIEALHEPSWIAGIATLQEAARASNAVKAGRRRMHDAAQRKLDLEAMSKDSRKPIVSEGMSLYDASSVVLRVNRSLEAGGALPNTTVDDIDGTPVTLAELARRAGWKVTPNKAHLEDTVEKKDSTGSNHKRALGEDPEAGYGTEPQEGTTAASTITSTTSRSTSDFSSEEETETSTATGSNGVEEEEQETKNKRVRGDNSNSNASDSGEAFQLKSKDFELPDMRRPRMHGVYMGCVEVRGGFRPVRDPSNKWYVSEQDLPDSAIPQGVQYHAGWGYLLSRDLVQHVVQKVNGYDQHPEQVPAWYRLLNWEDVLVGLLLNDVVPRPHSHPGFRPAWRSCAPDTVIRHLDIDSPRLLAGLLEQDVSGLSDEKPVQCSSGQFLPGDYAGWWAWKQRVTNEDTDLD